MDDSNNDKDTLMSEKVNTTSLKASNLTLKNGIFVQTEDHLFSDSTAQIFATLKPFDVAIDEFENFSLTEKKGQSIDATKFVFPMSNTTVLAGQMATPGYVNGDGSTALFGYVEELADSGCGELLVLDRHNNSIRAIVVDVKEMRSDDIATRGTVSTRIGRLPDASQTEIYSSSSHNGFTLYNPLCFTANSLNEIYVTDETPRLAVYHNNTQRFIGEISVRPMYGNDGDLIQKNPNEICCLSISPSNLVIATEHKSVYTFGGIQSSGVVLYDQKTLLEDIATESMILGYQIQEAGKDVRFWKALVDEEGSLWLLTNFISKIVDGHRVKKFDIDGLANIYTITLGPHGVIYFSALREEMWGNESTDLPGDTTSPIHLAIGAIYPNGDIEFRYLPYVPGHSLVVIGDSLFVAYGTCILEMKL